jgi:hypothetical protein
VSPGLDASLLGEAICAALRAQAEKLGVSIGDEPLWNEAVFVDQTDPFSREVSRVGTWRGKSRYGTVTLFANGRVFAEYQVLLPHPQDGGRYVEAVQVWGRPGDLRGDALIVEYPR